uniref:Uncharacterized protein n=1 Tax=Arundo donax TaxID=35708 RepID=A0A0A8YL90_ARUDO
MDCTRQNQKFSLCFMANSCFPQLSCVRVEMTPSRAESAAVTGNSICNCERCVVLPFWIQKLFSFGWQTIVKRDI